MRPFIVFLLLALCFTSTAQKFDTKYKYIDATGSNVIIQNSFPKGGLKYTDPWGRKFVYAVLWTRVSNESRSPLTLSLHFPATTFSLPDSPDTNFRLVLPSDTMTMAKESFFNYGLADLETLLDKALNQPTMMQRTILPNEACLFYIVAIYNKGVNGVVRGGLVLQENDLIYRITGCEVPCGRLDVEN